MLTPSIPKIFAFCGAWKWKRSKTRETVRSTRNSSTWSFKATFWCKHYQLTQPVINIVLSCSNLGDAFSYLVTKNASWVAITYGIPNHAFHTFSFFFFLARVSSRLLCSVLVSIIYELCCKFMYVHVIRAEYDIGSWSGRDSSMLSVCTYYKSIFRMMERKESGWIYICTRPRQKRCRCF